MKAPGRRWRRALAAAAAAAMILSSAPLVASAADLPGGNAEASPRTAGAQRAASPGEATARPFDNAQAAVIPSLEPEALRLREDRLSHELRCVVCQNQSLAESNAPLAADMRAVIREQLQAGRSDAEILAFFEQRYGDFVSFTPPWRASTWLLWLGPFAFAVGGLAWLVHRLRNRRAEPIADLTEEDQARLRRFLGPHTDTATASGAPTAGTTTTTATAIATATATATAKTVAATSTPVSAPTPAATPAAVPGEAP